MYATTKLFLIATQLLLPTLVVCSQVCRVPVTTGPGKATHDDSPAIQAALVKCAKNGVVEFTAGADYNTFSPITATSLSNVTIHMDGNLHFPQNLTSVQAIVNAAGGSLNWLTLQGSNVQYIGSSNVSNGWIYGYGQAWWDANTAQNPNGTGLAGRPHMMSFSATGGSLQRYKTRKPIAWNVRVSGSDVTVSEAFIDAVSNGSFPFNTDGFDVSGTNIVVEDSVIYNGDDAIAVGDGSHNITFRRNTFGYQSHGMSIGSLGKDQSHFNQLSNILFEDNTAINSLYGARFKSWIGGQGLVQNVTWSNIRLYNVTFPIFVTQSYYDQGITSPNSTRPNNSSVSMDGFTWSNFSGTVNTYNPGDGSCVTDPCWYDGRLPNLQHTESIIIECNTEDSCKNFELSNIQVLPESLVAPTQICINATAADNPHLGLSCVNGTYIPS